jgi:GTP cyclohydrolase FolE2
LQSCVKYLPDVAVKATRGKPLQKVGIDDVDIYRVDFNDRNVLTRQSAYISLMGVKGIHMSRLRIILQDWQDREIACDDELLDQISATHKTKFTYWECAWKSLFDVEDGQPIKVDCKLEGKKVFNDIGWYLSLGIPYASVCPCAAEMCASQKAGYPHMQRAAAIITGAISQDTDLTEFIPDVITSVASTVDIVPKPIMKRDDEYDWCKRAANTNLFVEDAAREISDTIDSLFDQVVVVCKHFESIHEHNVVAVCRKGDDLV